VWYFGDGRGDDCRSLIRFHCDDDIDSYVAFYDSKAGVYLGNCEWCEPPELPPGAPLLALR
jgi:hypothetical protein